MDLVKKTLPFIARWCRRRQLLTGGKPQVVVGLIADKDGRAQEALVRRARHGEANALKEAEQRGAAKRLPARLIIKVSPAAIAYSTVLLSDALRGRQQSHTKLFAFGRPYVEGSSGRSRPWPLPGVQDLPEPRRGPCQSATLLGGTRLPPRPRVSSSGGSKKAAIRRSRNQRIGLAAPLFRLNLSIPSSPVPAGDFRYFHVDREFRIFSEF